MSSLEPAAENNLDRRYCTFADCGVVRTMKRSDDAWVEGNLDVALRFGELATRVECTRRADLCKILTGMRFVTTLVEARALERAWHVYYSGVQRIGQLEALDSFQGRQAAAISKIVESTIRIAGGDCRKSARLAATGLLGVAAVELTRWTKLGQLTRALACLRLGDLQTATRSAQMTGQDETLSLAQTLSLAAGTRLSERTRGIGQTAWVRMQIAEAQKDRPRAWALAAELMATVPTMRELLIAQPAAAPSLVRLAMSCGERNVAEEMAHASWKLTHENPGFTSLAASAIHCHGLLTADIGRLKEAAGAHRDPWARASALEDAGTQMWRRRADRRVAIDILKQASGAYRHTGALRDAARIKGRLLDYGEKLGTVQELPTN